MTEEEYKKEALAANADYLELIMVLDNIYPNLAWDCIKKYKARQARLGQPVEPIIKKEGFNEMS